MKFQSPTLLSAASERATAWRTRLAEAGRVPAVADEELDYVLACSDFVADALLRDAALAETPHVSADAPFAGAVAIADEAEFQAELRRVRRRELARIAWRDLTGRATTAETLEALTALADAAIVAAHGWAERSLRERYGTPRDETGAEQPFIVVGMGKLGGRELNFSSDIDLVFLYPEHGETDGRRPIENVEYFTRLGQKLIQCLDNVTPEGFVYRVDMRLRPFGDSGALVASFAALEDYLQQHGRDWERYAWVKARAITGVEAYAELFRTTLRPFVFRRYLDFGVFASLREMKALIQREVERRELQDNVKLGPGGIREIEFVAQAFQLLRGGSDPQLQPASLLTVLPRLEGQKRLSARAVRELLAAYEYLRRLENRLQIYADEQTHQLPATDERCARLCAAMRVPDWATLLHDLDQHRDRVSGYFASLVLAQDAPADPPGDFDQAYAAEPDPERIAAAVAALGCPASEPIVAALVALRSGGYWRRLDDFGRKRLTTLLPRLLRAAVRHDDAATVLVRALGVVEAIGSRTSYLALLNESSLALQRLIEICALGSFLPTQIAAFPLLLDELVDDRLFDEPPSRAQFEREIDARAGAAGDDVERYVELLRAFQRAAVFRIALFDLTGRLPLMHVSDRLTDVAELILDRVMRRAWREVTTAHGVPTCGEEGALRECDVAAVGYGKLGGLELGYGSDLDLVFLHDSAGSVQQTAGPKVVDNQVFFLRLGQKIVHYLTVHTPAGRLYEVDMRLRPSGKGGLLMTNVNAFADYQKTEAWTWEHQALLHSRAVAGAGHLRAAFEAVRLDILSSHVKRATLRDEVRNMRERMRRELSKGGEGQFDIKQDPGGVADVEFLAQYWTLKWADRYPPLVTYPDTIRQLESVGSAALVDHAVIDDLVNAYRSYRRVTHRMSLEQAKPVVPNEPHADTRRRVSEIWEAVMVHDEALAAPPPAGLPRLPPV
jgi:[glutamine synthetase] adenylyltransferase / [glutamine synthetase]-adenylyl-L-tyrosine phosphorylase